MASSSASASASGSSSSRPAPTAGKPDRLYVGNLAPSVDEYTLLQVFGKHGAIARLDVMYHKSGPQRGKPRGYAFVEYTNRDDALAALVRLHDRPLRGRRLLVTYASAAPAEDFLGPGPRARRGDAPRPTALSLRKAPKKPLSAAQQIAAMEAKLAQLQQRPGRSPSPPRPVGAAEAAEAASALEAEIRRELAAPARAPAGDAHSPPRTPAPPRDPPGAQKQTDRARGLASLPPKPPAAT